MNHYSMKKLIFIILLLLSACAKDDQDPIKRTYRMGFQNSAPRFGDIDLVLQSLNLWTTRSDAAMITTEVPWAELLDGTTATDYVIANYKDLVTFYRGKNLKLWVYIDPANGLDRTSDAQDLVAAGKSIADADMQTLYQQFTLAMVEQLQPDHLGLALETNLIRAASPASIYEGVKAAANTTAVAIRSEYPDLPLSVSIQADYAWGKLGGGSYRGIDQDFIDFPFIDELGISSYPYFEFENPGDIPVNYYSRLVEGKSIPVFVSEGGWTSASITTADYEIVSTPEIQRDYISHHGRLLDEVGAVAVFQLLFTDLDASSLPADIPENIYYFTSLGLVDIDMQPKPALSVWDELFKNRPLAE